MSPVLLRNYEREEGRYSEEEGWEVKGSHSFDVCIILVQND